MARNRMIKPEFFCSEQVTDCSYAARMLFIGMWCFSDDAGHMPDSVKRLKMLVFPADLVRIDEVGAMLQELIDVGVVRRYEVEGQGYLEITGWSKHQVIRRPVLRYPAPIQGVVTPRAAKANANLPGSQPSKVEPNQPVPAAGLRFGEPMERSPLPAMQPTAGAFPGFVVTPSLNPSAMTAHQVVQFSQSSASSTDCISGGASVTFQLPNVRDKVAPASPLHPPQPIAPVQSTTERPPRIVIPAHAENAAVTKPMEVTAAGGAENKSRPHKIVVAEASEPAVPVARQAIRPEQGITSLPPTGDSPSPVAVPAPEPAPVPIPEPAPKPAPAPIVDPVPPTRPGTEPVTSSPPATVPPASTPSPVIVPSVSPSPVPIPLPASTQTPVPIPLPATSPIPTVASDPAKPVGLPFSLKDEFVRRKNLIPPPQVVKPAAKSSELPYSLKQEFLRQMRQNELEKAQSHENRELKPVNFQLSQEFLNRAVPNDSDPPPPEAAAIPAPAAPQVAEPVPLPVAAAIPAISAPQVAEPMLPGPFESQAAEPAPRRRRDPDMSDLDIPCYLDPVFTQEDLEKMEVFGIKYSEFRTAMNNRDPKLLEIFPSLPEIWRSETADAKAAAKKALESTPDDTGPVNTGPPAIQTSAADPNLPEIPKALQDPHFVELWEQWLLHRLEQRNPMTPTAALQQLQRLLDWGLERSCRALEHSLRNGYRGIYEPSSKQNNGPPRGPQSVGVSA